ncbi:MAG: sterol desaturase family protein [Myxococcaceae bacterium]|nr:sterol desaturase family protein [Myxococcaceae bacterium]
MNIPEGPAQLRAKNTLRHEVRYTALTAVVGLAMGAGATLLVREGLLPLASDPLTLGRGLFEVGLYIFLFDAYFYALHRLLHVKVLYQRIHVVHHHSTSPTLWTALAFHPVEAVLIMGFMPVAMFLIPIHFVCLVIVSLFLSGSILLAHCGVEVFPRWWHRVPLLNWYVTPGVHEAHHQRRDCNYSATLSIFDRLFGTLRHE